MSTHVAPSAATIAPRSIPPRYVYTSVHDRLRCLQPMWVQCLGFTRQLSATYCAHLVLISNFLFPQCAFQLPASICFHMYVSPRWPLHNFLPLCCSISEFLLRPCASQQLPACIWFQYLGSPCLSTTSCAHLVSLSNFPPVPLVKLL